MGGFRKAKAFQAALKLGLYGPPGSGKTFTALLLAEKLATLRGKRVAYIDTERGTDFYCQAVKERKVHPEAFDFDAIYSRSLTDVASAVYGVNPDEHGIIVVDSITHLWEAARNAYEGKMTKIGSIPFHAWSKIKKPYKELVAYLLSSPCHVIFCGREGNEYEEDEQTGELKQIGKKMKAEGETPYEPHILIRMEPARSKAGTIYRGVVEKDRTGVLAGQVIENPSFENICAPLLPLLGDEQAILPSEDDVAAKDAVALADADAARQKISSTYRDDFEARFKLAKNIKDLNAISKELSAAVKKLMTVADVAALREAYRTREQQLSGEFRLEPVDA